LSAQQPPSFAGATLALLTRHQKLPLVASALAPLGFNLQLTEAFDTDQLGTFSGEIARTQTPLQAALHKAKLAAELTGARYGLGSEGSFGGGPLPGLLNWDQELLVWFDTQTGQQVVAEASGAVSIRAQPFTTLASLHDILTQAPSGQAWMLQLDTTAKQPMYKGLQSQADIEAALTGSGWQSGQSVTLLPDLRAMHCPERQQYIRQAAMQLAAQLQQRCPACGAADFSVKSQQRGLPCASCLTATTAVLWRVQRCDCCGHQLNLRTEQLADPACCPQCNP